MVGEIKKEEILTCTGKLDDDSCNGTEFKIYKDVNGNFYSICSKCGDRNELKL